MTVYNKAAFEVAHTKYLADATTLNDGDIEQLAVISDTLASRARAKRDGFVPAETAEERKMLNGPATRPDPMQAIDDVIMPALAVHKFKRKQLESQLIEMGRQLTDAQTELRYLQWARQQELEKVPR